ncbi:hypothetical protein D3C85_1451370 [compost metagenome]
MLRMIMQLAIVEVIWAARRWILRVDQLPHILGAVQWSAICHASICRRIYRRRARTRCPVIVSCSYDDRAAIRAKLDFFLTSVAHPLCLR